ncbi:BRCA1-associated RING domain protein 1, partial [Araneus ventricosus]
GDVAKVKELLKEGAIVNTQDNNGWTPLHEASNRGFIEIAQLLLDAGALVNVPSLKDNITPLHDALLNDMMPMAILLVSRGADLHAKTSFGYTALDLCKKDGDRKILTEACSPFIEANTLIPDTKTLSKKADKIVLLCSNLDEKQKEKLQKCAQMLKADIVDDFKPEVTHVITSCDNQGNCPRTMKVLMGILTGKWIMNFSWIEICLEYKQKVDEEVFEVQGTRNQPNSQGPKRGRQNYEQKCPPLFDGFYFYLHGTFSSPTPTREDLCNLVHLGGGKILSREPKADAIDAFMIPYHAAASPLEDTSHMILYQERPPREKHLRSGHICTTQVMWLVACISEFKIVEPQQTKVVNK